MSSVGHPERDVGPNLLGRGVNPPVSRWRRALHVARHPAAWTRRNARYLWTTGVRARRSTQSVGALVDARWYLERYPDVRAARADPVRHFLRFGIREGRQPNALIDPQVYLEEHPDATSGLLLEVHLRVDQRVGLPPFS